MLNDLFVPFSTHSSKRQRDVIIKSFHGKVRKLIRHKVAYYFRQGLRIHFILKTIKIIVSLHKCLQLDLF